MQRSTDEFTRGVEYLRQIQRVALDPSMIEVLEQSDELQRIAPWIGTHIEPVNQILHRHLEACHACFYPHDRRPMRIFAAPIGASYGIDGLCNIWADPVTLLIDVGRVVPQDWIGIVVHEYAHAYLGNSGHDAAFALTLGHLCLGLGLPEPPESEALLKSHPPCVPTPHPLALWRGQSDNRLSQFVIRHS
jgi:hypothetical protein